MTDGNGAHHQDTKDTKGTARGGTEEPGDPGRSGQAMRTVASLQPVALAGCAASALALGACGVNRSVEPALFQQMPTVTALTSSVQEVPYPDESDAEAVVNPRAEIRGVIIMWKRLALRDAGLISLLRESVADEGTPLALLEWGTIEGGEHELLLLLDDGIGLGGCLLCTSTYYIDCT
jgi:hypothetical protein